MIFRNQLLYVKEEYSMSFKEVKKKRKPREIKCKSSLNGQKEITNPLIQIREFVDGTWSVVARIWNPKKKFYEHPTLINLTKKEAQKHCSVLIKNPPTIYEIVKHWRFIGD